MTKNRKKNTGANTGVSVTVNVNVEKIVEFMCIAGVLIVGIIFISKVINNKIAAGKRD